MNTKHFILILTACLMTLNCAAQERGVIVADSAQYAPEFVKYWNYLSDWGVEIIADSIIVNGENKNPILIPTGLPFSEVVKYTCQKEGVDWTLKVKRVSYTNVEFQIGGANSDSTVFVGEGLAILSPTFYLACAGEYQKSELEVFGLNNYPFHSGDIDNGAMLIPGKTDEMIGYSHQVNGMRLVLRFIKSEKK